MMGYNPLLVAEWYHSTGSKQQFMALCYNEHNMKMEAAEDYWELCNALAPKPTAEQCGTPAEQQATPAGVPETQFRLQNLL